MRSYVILLFLIALDQAQSQESLYPIQVNGKWGFIDREGTVVIRPQFDWNRVSMPEDGIMIIDLGERFGILNQKGEILFEPQFDRIPVFQGNVCWVQKNEKWGLIDRSGTWIIEPRFDIAYDFIGVYAKVEQNGLYGLVDSSGTIVLEPRFSDLSQPSEDLIAANDGSGWGYIDMSGKYVFSKRFSRCYDFYNGYALVNVNYNRWKIIDKTGGFTTDTDFDYLGESGGGLFYAQLGDTKGLVDHLGNFVLKSESCRYYSRNFIQYEENAKIGFRTADGRVLVRPQFVAADDMGEGWIVVVDEKNRMGFIDTLGQIGLKPQSEFFIDLTSETRFREGRLIVRTKKKYGVIDRDLKWVVRPRYDLISSYRHGWAVFNIGGKMVGELPVITGGKCGFIDPDGKEIVPVLFDRVEYFDDNLAQVMIGSAMAYVNKAGKIVWKAGP